MKFEVIKIIDDKPETVRYQRKYVMIRVFDSDPNETQYDTYTSATWSIYDNTTHEYYLDDDKGMHEMVWKFMEENGYDGVKSTALAHEIINHYTREVLEYANM